MALTIEVDIRQEDFAEYTKFVQGRQVSQGIYSGFFVFLITALVAIHYALGPNLPVLAASAVATLAAMTLLSTALSGQMQPVENGFVLGRKTFETEQDGLRVRSEKSDTLFYWSSFEAFAATDDEFYLFLEPIAGLILPRRDLTPTDEDSLLAVLRERCPQLSDDLRNC
jgi:hypothetical protein